MTRVVQTNRTFTATIKGRKLKQGTDKCGYKVVDIGGKNRKAHRLVMEAFVGVSTMTVNHKDADKTNNHIDNLEYVTSRDNLLYGTGMERRRLAAQRRAKAVCQIERKTGLILGRRPSLVAVERDGFSSQAVGRACQGKLSHHKGFVWRYASDIEGAMPKEIEGGEHGA